MNAYQKHVLALSARIVGAHVAHNDVDKDNLPAMIRNVYNTLVDLGDAESFVPGNDSATMNHRGHDGHEHEHHNHMHVISHAENVYVHPTFGQTVFGDHLVCMECGVSMKMLKRHLLTVHAMTPDDYRTKWDLPSDYPMVAADYAKLRSSLALESGLGLKPDDRTTKGRKGRG